MFYSPLRYPGGKNRLAKFIAQICIDNSMKNCYVEPYAGGASVALYLLLQEHVDRVVINDYDKSIYAFWFCVLNKPEFLCKKISDTPISIEEWKVQKNIQKNKSNASLEELGFSTLFLNRTNRSGIINAGVIGGYAQKGIYKLDIRFNKKRIIEKIEMIAEHKKQVELKNLDCIQLIETIKDNRDLIYYFDPPYYLKGSSLYTNAYSDNDHEQLAQKIKAIQNSKWIVSYDNQTAIKKLYRWARSHDYKLNHFSGHFKKGEEMLFFSKNLTLKNSVFDLIKA